MAPWTSVVAPRATPAPVVSRLSAELVEIMRLPEVTALLEKQVLSPAPQAPDEFLQFIKQELAKWDKVIKSAGIKVE